MDTLALSIALSNRLAELSRWSSTLDSWLNRWTALVVVGVALEVAFVVWEYQIELQEFRRGTIHSPDKPRLVKYLIEFLGAGLVAMGVAGELVVHTRSGRIETEMRDVTTRQVSIANTRAGDAVKEAARLSKDAAKLTKDAEDERLARVTIEAQVAWRHLTETQEKEIGSSIGRRFSNQGISVWFSTGDTEGSSFARDILRALLSAGTLRVYGPANILRLTESVRRGSDPIPPMLTGVRVQSTMDEPSRQLADAIIPELTSRGFDAVRETSPPFDPNPIPQVWVNVWARPTGPQGEFKLAAHKVSVPKK